MKRFVPALVPALLVVVASLATGCVNIERTDYDKSANARVKKIALLPVTEPTPVVMNIGSGTAAFGLVGGLVQAGINDSNRKRLKEAFDERHITFADRIVATATDELRKHGFEVVYLADQRPKVNSDGKTLDYSGIRTDADAILNVWPGVTGYASPAFSLDYQPWITMGARLVDPKTQKTMYYRIFRSGFGSSNENVEDVGYDETYKFGSIDALVQGADKAAEGLRDGHRRAIGRMVTHLR